MRSEGFSLPRQHALVHYRHHIQNFGAPNGLCSSITESKHIEAVKKPWRRSNRYNALQQMLRVNMRNDKLTAARIDFQLRGMLDGTCLGDALRALVSNQDDINEDTTADSDGDDPDPDSDHDDDGRSEGGPCGPVDGPPVLGEVTLALKKGTFTYHSLCVKTDISSSHQISCNALGIRTAHWPMEPRRSCLRVPFLSSEPRGSPSATHHFHSLVNHRRCTPLSLPFRTRCILRPQQPFRNWWHVLRDHPFYSSVEVGG